MSLRKTDCWSGGSKELMQGLILAGGFKNETSEGIDFIVWLLGHNVKLMLSGDKIANGTML